MNLHWAKTTILKGSAFDDNMLLALDIYARHNPKALTYGQFQRLKAPVDDTIPMIWDQALRDRMFIVQDIRRSIEHEIHKKKLLWSGFVAFVGAALFFAQDKGNWQRLGLEQPAFIENIKAPSP